MQSRGRVAQEIAGELTLCCLLCVKISAGGERVADWNLELELKNGISR